MVGLLTLAICSVAEGQGTIAPVAHQVFLTNAGAPLVNGKICTYSASTTTPLATYSNEALTTELPNPIRTNSAGRPQNASGTETNVYWAAQSYRVDVLTAGSDGTCSTGTTIYSADNVPAIPALAAAIDVTGTAGENLLAGDVVFLSDGSGGQTAGRWYKADADNTYSSTTAGMVGVAPANINSGVSGSIRLQGRITGLSALTAGEKYYASATAGALTATPPTNARFIAEADSTTSIVVSSNPGAVTFADSNGTHSYVMRTDVNLTADRLVTMNFGDAGGVITHPALNVMEGRCTLTTAAPVTTADVTAATTLYYALYTGNRVTLYDGSAQWNTRTIAQLSIAVPATTDTMYDVFIDDTAGVPALEVVAWTNDTTRATALALQNGVYVQTSDTDSRYVCSFRTTGVSGQTEDSFAKRYVWNYYNRVPRALRVIESDDDWTYQDTAYRQWNGAAVAQVDVVVGVAEALLDLQAALVCYNGTANLLRNIAIGEDSTTAAMTTVIIGGLYSANLANNIQTLTAAIAHYPAIGRHYYTGLESGSATAATTCYGDGNQGSKSGLWGSIPG